MGKLTEKRVRGGRRAAGLTFGTAMTTSSAPVALRAASQKVLAAVPRVPALRRTYLVFFRKMMSRARSLPGPSKGRAMLYSMGPPRCEVAASRSTLQPRTRYEGASAAPFQP